MKRYRSLFFAFMIVLLVVGCGVYSQSQSDLLERFEISENDGITEIELAINSQVEPVVSFVRAAGLLQIDLPGVRVNKDLLKSPVRGENVKLAYAVESEDTSWQSAGIRIFPEQGRVASLKKMSGGLKILVAESFDLPAVKHPSQHALISPQEKKYAPVIINCEHMPLLPVFAELAVAAGIDMHYEGEFPGAVSAFVEASDPLSAIRELADINELKLFRTGQNSWLLTSPASDRS